MSAVKFTFDTEFADGAAVVSEAARTRKRLTLTQAELDALCTDARTEGFRAGEVLALEAIAAGTQEVLGALDRALAQATDEIEGLRAHSAEIALAAARKLARMALAELPAPEVEQCLREAMHQAIGEPRITLRAAPKVAEALKARVADIAHEEAFEGRVQISEDPTLHSADCRIEWRGGGAERAEAALEASLAELFTRRFSNAAPVHMTED